MARTGRPRTNPRTAEELGRMGNSIYIFHACVECGRQRWVRLIKGVPRNTLCLSCKQKGDRNQAWTGGRTRTPKGYITRKLPFGSPFLPMATKGGNIMEHRFVMAEHLGRCLLKDEQVHHRNGVKDDNRLENLQLVDANAHSREHKYIRDQVCALEARVIMLEAENAALRAQLGGMKGVEHGTQDTH